METVVENLLALRVWDSTWEYVSSEFDVSRELCRFISYSYQNIISQEPWLQHTDSNEHFPNTIWHGRLDRSTPAIRSWWLDLDMHKCPKCPNSFLEHLKPKKHEMATPFPCCAVLSNLQVRHQLHRHRVLADRYMTAMMPPHPCSLSANLDESSVWSLADIFVRCQGLLYHSLGC